MKIPHPHNARKMLTDAKIKSNANKALEIQGFFNSLNVGDKVKYAYYYKNTKHKYLQDNNGSGVIVHKTNNFIGISYKNRIVTVNYTDLLSGTALIEKINNKAEGD